MSSQTGDLTRRDQRTAESRQRILEAAVECLVEGGHHGATTLRIQAKAGVSRGRLLHHFPTREGLLAAAAEHLANERIQGTFARKAAEIPTEASLSERVSTAVEAMWLSFHEPHFWAVIELWVAARTNDRLAQTLLPGERELGELIRDAVDRAWGPDLVQRPRYPELRDVLLTSMRGAALTYSFNPRDPATDPHLATWSEISRILLLPNSV